MTRSLSGSSRSYLGRSDRRAVQLTQDSVLLGNMEKVRSEVSRGHSRCRDVAKSRQAAGKQARRIEKAGRITPLLFDILLGYS
jgi:hypothetical protein